MAAYAYDADPSDLQDALSDLDAMMAEWETKSIDIDWPLSSNPPTDADIEADSLAPLSAVSAIFLNLAVRIAPDIGKTVSTELAGQAKAAFDALQGAHTKPPRRRLQGLPSGAGARRTGYGSTGFNPLPDVKTDFS